MGLAPRPHAEDVADDAADARAGAAVGIDGAGVVVGLDLERQARAAVELDDAGVVVEHADTKGPVELARGVLDRFAKEVLDVLAVQVDRTGEGLVLAVLAPGLRERLELAQRGLAFELDVVGLNGAHLLERERELAGA